jgi:hypothetical protein
MLLRPGRRSRGGKCAVSDRRSPPASWLRKDVLLKPTHPASERLNLSLQGADPGLERRDLGTGCFESRQDRRSDAFRQNLSRGRKALVLCLASFKIDVAEYVR